MLYIWGANLYERYATVDYIKSRAKAKPAVYPADWRDSFGIPVMEHMASMQVDLMEGYTFADVSKGTEQMPMEIVDQETGEVIKV